MIRQRAYIPWILSGIIAVVLVLTPLYAAGQNSVPPPAPIEMEPFWTYVVGPDGEIMPDPRQPTTPLTVLANDHQPPPLNPDVDTTGGEYDPELDAWVYDVPPDDPSAGALAYPPLDEVPTDAVDCESDPVNRLQQCQIVLKAVMPVLAFVLDTTSLLESCGAESTVFHWDVQALDSSGEWMLIGNGEWLISTLDAVGEPVSAVTDRMVLSLEADSCASQSIEHLVTFYGRP